MSSIANAYKQKQKKKPHIENVCMKYSSNDSVLITSKAYSHRIKTHTHTKNYVTFRCSKKNVVLLVRKNDKHIALFENLKKNESSI